MAFSVTTQVIKQSLEPLGFEVEIDSQYEDEDWLRITNPSYEGIVIVACVLNDDGIFDELVRKVEGGIEGGLSHTVSEEEFNALPEAQKNHLYHIDFGENLDYQSLATVEDFVSLVQQKIVPVSTL